MRQAIDTAPINGDFVILEDDAEGAYAVARWSAEAAQWVDEAGTPSQINPTHWHPLATAPSTAAATDELGSLTDPRELSARRIGREALRHASGDMTTQPSRTAKRARSVNVLAGFVGRGSGKILSALAVTVGWVLERRRGILAMAACLLVGVGFAPFLYSSDLGKRLLHRTVPGGSAELKQALQQEQERASRLASDVIVARREAESQAALMRQAGEAASREKETAGRALVELRQALQFELANTEKLAGQLAEAARAEGETERVIGELRQAAEKLAGELAATRQEIETQKAVAQAASDETRRTAEAYKRVVDEQDQALREARDKAAKLETRLAAARREVQSQILLASSARNEAASMKEAAERSTDEQRRALQQERSKTERLAAELAKAKSSLKAQAKAANDVARDDQLAAVQVGRPSAAAPSVSEAPTMQPTADAMQPVDPATRPAANPEGRSPQAVRLIARANLLLEQGNIGAARNMLDRAAEMGSAEALFWLAETYDPALLSARQTFGTQSDIAKARELYDRALSGGVSEAKLRLEALQQ